MERSLFFALKKDYPLLEEWEVIIDIPEPINFESHIPIIGSDGVMREILNEDMVFTGEVSALFQKSLRKVALYLPSYVESKAAEKVMEEYENE